MNKAIVVILCVMALAAAAFGQGRREQMFGLNVPADDRWF
jgi:hypothetical protein